MGDWIIQIWEYVWEDKDYVSLVFRFRDFWSNEVIVSKHKRVCYKRIFYNTPLHKKLYEVIDKEYQRNLVLGCLLIERFVHLVNPKTHAKVRYYDREYLAGRFVMGEWNTNKLFGDNPFHSYIEKMAPEEKKKFDSFLELADILLNPEPKVPF